MNGTLLKQSTYGTQNVYMVREIVICQFILFCFQSYIDTCYSSFRNLKHTNTYFTCLCIT